MSVDAREKLRKCVAASDEEARAFAKTLNIALAKLYDVDSQQVYFLLFRKIDERRRGQIFFDEFAMAVRDGLGVTSSKISDASLVSFWRCFDTKASGVMPMAAFLKLMRLGWPDYQSKRKKLSAKQPDFVTSSFRGLLTPRAAAMNAIVHEPAWALAAAPSDDRAADSESERRAIWTAFHDDHQRSLSKRAKVPRGRLL